VGAALAGHVRVVPLGPPTALAAATPAADARQQGGAADATGPPHDDGGGGGVRDGCGAAAGTVSGSWVSRAAASCAAAFIGGGAAAGAAAGAAVVAGTAAVAGAAAVTRQLVAMSRAALTKHSPLGGPGVVGDGGGGDRHHLQASHIAVERAAADGDFVSSLTLGLRDRLQQLFQPMPAGHGGQLYANIMPEGSWFDWHRHRPGDIVSRLPGALGWPWALGMRAKGRFLVQVALVVSGASRGLGLRRFNAHGVVTETCFWEMLVGFNVHVMSATAEGAFDLLPSQGGGHVEHAVTIEGEGVAEDAITNMFKARALVCGVFAVGWGSGVGRASSEAGLASGAGGPAAGRGCDGPAVCRATQLGSLLV
jgi:hypothetical protein